MPKNRDIIMLITKGGDKNMELEKLDLADITCIVRVQAKFNNYPHYMQKVLIKITEINETKKIIYGYLMRIL